jgi:hypothetical protein
MPRIFKDGHCSLISGPGSRGHWKTSRVIQIMFGTKSGSTVRRLYVSQITNECDGRLTSDPNRSGTGAYIPVGLAT